MNTHPHNQARSTPQEAFNLQRAAQVYGTRALIPVTSKATPNLSFSSHFTRSNKPGTNAQGIIKKLYILLRNQSHILKAVNQGIKAFRK